MARPFRTKGARGGIIAARVATFGVAAVTIMAMVSSGGAANATPITPTGYSGYNLSANGTGLNISLFGTQLTGGTSSASVSYDGSTTPATETASSSGTAVLLTSSGAASTVTQSAATAGPTTAGSSTPSCFQDQNGGEDGVGLSVLVSCAGALSTVDPSSDGPDAAGTAYLTQVNVTVAGILNELYSSGVDQLCSALYTEIPTLGTILGGACDALFTSIQNTVSVTLGQSKSAIISTPSLLEANDTSSSIDITIAPIDLSALTAALGGTLPTSLQGISNGEPLLEVTIPSATATTTYTAANGWSNSYDATLIKVSGVLVDLLEGASGSEIEIPPSGTGNALSTLNSSPLGTLLTVDLASGSTSGSATGGGSTSSQGLDVTVLPGEMGGIVINGGTAGTSGGNGPATSPSSVAPTKAATSPAVPTVAAATSPTAVHTGEWWAGSLPLIGLLAAMGGALIGWPRLRRMALVSRFTRSSR